MYKLILICLICCTCKISGQTTPVDVPPPDAPSTAKNNADSEKVIFEKVEIEASFPGGDEAWRKHLERTLNPAIPAENGAPEGIYTVIVQFLVGLDGKISEVKALTSHGYGMEKEVIRVIKAGPQWKPAILNGLPVKAFRKQPVTFHVIVEKKRRKNKN